MQGVPISGVRDLGDRLFRVLGFIIIRFVDLL